MFSGYQPCQLVKRQINQRFKNNLCPHPQGADQPQNILLYKVTVKATSHARYNVSVARDEEWRKKIGETMGRSRSIGNKKYKKHSCCPGSLRKLHLFKTFSFIYTK
jgi:hypothetical protein